MMTLADDLVNMVKDIFLTELLSVKEMGSTIDDNLADEFDNIK